MTRTRKRPMERIKKKIFEITVDFDSLASIKIARDRCSIFFFTHFIPEDVLRYNSDHYDYLITLQNSMIKKSIDVISYLNLAVLCHKNRDWDKETEEWKKGLQKEFVLHCQEFCELGIEFDNKRELYKKTLDSVGQS